eukprot:scaffold181240_cov39-Tisochrysis_lutea.AAC.1
MALRQTTLTEYRYGAADMSVSRREERRWRRDISRRPSKPSASEQYIVDSAAEIAFVLKNRYSEQIVQNKYIVEMQIPTGRGNNMEIMKKYWTLTPAFLDRLENGYEAEDGEQCESDYEEVEVMMKTATGPVRMTIRDVHHPSNFNWSRPNGEFFKWYVDMDVYERHTEAKNHNTPCLINALEESGVPQDLIESIKRRFMRSRISRANIKQLIGDSKEIQLQIRTLNDKNLVKLGN